MWKLKMTFSISAKPSSLSRRLIVLVEVMKLSHILVRHEYEVEDLLRKLSEGVEFSELAAKFSICPSGKAGGSLGNISKGQTVKAFEEAAFSLQPGEISGRVKTEFGYHLILRED